MTALIHSAAIELHAARAAFQYSGDSFTERRVQGAEQLALTLLERFGGELRQAQNRAERGLVELMEASPRTQAIAFVGDEVQQ